MSVDKRSGDNRIWLAGIYYISASLLYVLSIFVEALQPEIFAAVLMLGTAAELIIKKRITFRSFTDKMIAAYFLYNALSVIWLVKSGMPYTVYLWEFAVSLLPVIFYYVGRACNDGFMQRKNTFAFYGSFIFAMLIMAVSVILIPVIMPQLHTDWSEMLPDISFIAALPGAIGERSERWIAAVNNMYSTWLGNGLGANGFKAIGIEDAHAVTDGGLVKMYCEQGIFGFSMFIYAVILSFKSGLKNIRKYCAELVLTAAALILSVGSDVLSYQLTAPVFWFAAGRIMSAAADGEQTDRL